MNLAGQTAKLRVWIELMEPVIIVGAGLSGLACALTLHKAKRSVMVLDQNADVGGRVRSQNHASGFVLDEGFQVLLDSYPELIKFIDLHSLKLGKFRSGALIFDGKKLNLLANPIQHPHLTLNSLLENSFSFSDKLKVLSLVTKARSHEDDSEVLEVSTHHYLLQHGFSSRFIEDFWRPFFLVFF